MDKKYRQSQDMWFVRELTALPLPQPVPLDLAHPPPSVPHGVRPIPVFVKLLQALEVDGGEVRADPLPNPPPPLAGVLSPRLAEFVLEVFPSDPPAEKQSTACSGGAGTTAGWRQKGVGPSLQSPGSGIFEPFCSWMEKSAQGCSAWLAPASQCSIHPWGARSRRQRCSRPCWSKAPGRSRAPLDAISERRTRQRSFNTPALRAPHRRRALHAPVYNQV